MALQWIEKTIFGQKVMMPVDVSDKPTSTPVPPPPKATPTVNTNSGFFNPSNGGSTSTPYSYSGQPSAPTLPTVNTPTVNMNSGFFNPSNGGSTGAPAYGGSNNSPYAPPTAPAAPAGPTGGGVPSAAPTGGGGAPAVPAPARWNVDAPSQDRLARFKSNPVDAQSEILAIKDMYEKEMAGGASPERLNQIHDWATQVRGVAGIPENDIKYGNGVPKAAPTLPPTGLGTPAFTGGTGGGVTPPPPTPTPAANPFPVRNMADISKYVDGQIAKKLSDAALAKKQAQDEALANAGKTRGSIGSTLTNAVNRLTTTAQQAQQGIQTGYERDRSLIKDNRALEDFHADDVLTPFSGRSDYARGQMAREREITDRHASEDLQSRIGGINTDLNNNLSQAQLDAQNKLNGIDSDLSVLQQRLTENYNQLQNTTGPERERLMREISNDERQYALAIRGEDRQDVLTNATLARDQFNQALQTFNANRGVYESDRTYDMEGKHYDDSFNYNKDTFNLDKWYKEQMVANDKIRANNSGSSNPSDSVAAQRLTFDREQWDYKLKHPEDAKSQLDMHINNLAKVWMQKQDDGNYAVTNEAGLRQAIMDLNLPTQDTMQALATFGLPLIAPTRQGGPVEMN